MQKIDYRSSTSQTSWIGRHLPGLFFYTKTFVDVVAAYRLSKKGLYTIEKKISSSAKVLKTLERIGVDFIVENIGAFKDLKTPCIFVGNHMSVLETFVLPRFIMPHKKITFVLKKSLTEYPIFRHIIQSLHPIVVDRKNPRKDLKAVLDQGLARLRKNTSILIFPQTTRSVHFDPKAFNTLGIKLAKKGNIPIIPIALKTDAWGIGRFLKDFGAIDPTKPVRISFGDPIYITGNGKEEHRKVIDFISGELHRWR